jgi:hypothetical protein
MDRSQRLAWLILALRQMSAPAYLHMLKSKARWHGYRSLWA